MALRDKVKDKHRIEVPPPAPEPVAVFDQARADQVLRETNDAVGVKYPSGSLEWIIANRKDIWTALCEGENAVDVAYIDCDLPGLVKATDLLQRMYMKAFDVFNSRPPIVEVQADLSL